MEWTDEFRTSDSFGESSTSARHSTPSPLCGVHLFGGVSLEYSPLPPIDDVISGQPLSSMYYYF